MTKYEKQLLEKIAASEKIVKDNMERPDEELGMEELRAATKAGADLIDFNKELTEYRAELKTAIAAKSALDADVEKRSKVAVKEERSAPVDADEQKEFRSAIGNATTNATQPTLEDFDDFLSSAMTGGTPDPLNFDHTALAHMRSERGRDFEHFASKAPLGSLDVDKRAMTYGVDVQGGHVIEETVPTRIYRYLETYGGVRRAGAQVIPLTGNAKVPFQAAAITTTNNVVAENTQVPDETIQLGSMELVPVAYPIHIDITDPLLASLHGPALREFVMEYMTAAVAKRTEKHFIDGNGTGQPTGILHAPASSVRTEGSTAINGDDLAKLIYNSGALVEDPRSVLMFNSIHMPALLKVATGYNSNLMTPSAGDYTGQVIWGQPVIFNDLMPATLTANAYTVIYGVFNAGYVIGELRGMRFEVERDARYQRSVLVASVMLDAGVRDVNAFRVLQQKA